MPIKWHKVLEEGERGMLNTVLDIMMIIIHMYKIEIGYVNICIYACMQTAVWVMHK